MYSAHLFWKPDKIYLHTDAGPETIARARASGTRWTKRILSMPNLMIHPVAAPHVTQKGVNIQRIEHKTDFLRLEVLREFGGVYLDTDAIPLRDIADLRNSGFRNIVAQEFAVTIRFANNLNNGVMMSIPDSKFMTIFYHAAHQFYDGKWATASTHLLTDLANRLAALPFEVLILQPQAFSPVSWEYEDQRRLFLPTMDTTTATSSEDHQAEQLLRAAAVQSGSCQDMLAWLKNREKMKHGKDADLWELDFSSSYVLHAFDGEIEKILGKDQEIDVKYVLDRQSNYARAVFPAVWHAVQEGIIPKDEI
ncbi:hypothetical protein VTI74DRAFT_1485 [Chaetomium olivicolor]